MCVQNSRGIAAIARPAPRNTSARVDVLPSPTCDTGIASRQRHEQRHLRRCCHPYREQANARTTMMTWLLSPFALIRHRSARPGATADRAPFARPSNVAAISTASESCSHGNCARCTGPQSPKPRLLTTPAASLHAASKPIVEGTPKSSSVSDGISRSPSKVARGLSTEHTRVLSSAQTQPRARGRCMLRTLLVSARLC